MSDSYPTYDESTGSRSDYPEVRIEAAIRMGQTDSQAHAGELLLMLWGDSDPRVRAAASTALENMDHDAVVRALESAVKGSAPEQMLDYQVLAIKLLGRRRDSDSVKALSGLLTRREKEIRSAALRALELIGGEAAAMAICKSFLEAVDCKERIESLGRMKEPAAVPYLRAATTSMKREVYAAAIEALGLIRDPSTLDAFQNAAGHGLAPIRYQAILALRRLGGPSVLPALCASQSDSDPGVRKAARNALGVLKAKENTAILCEALGLDSRQLRLGALRRIAERNDPEAAPYLWATMEDEDEEVRSEAWNSLAKLAVRESFPLLADVLNAGPRLRLGAVRRIGKLGDEAAVPALIPLLQDANGYIRAAAATALGRLRASEAAEAIATLLDHPESVVRAAAATALGDLRRRSVLPAIRIHLRTFGGEPVEQVRTALKHALRQIEAETDQRADLPLAAEAPQTDPSKLPRPATDG